MRLDDFVSGPGGLSARDFPGTWHLGEMSLTVTYRFDPGDPADGVTVHVPLAALNQVPEEGFDWQVPGFRDDLVAALMKSLPKEHRRELVPMAEVTAKVLGALTVTDEPLNVALARAVREVTDVRVPAHAFDTMKVPAHLRVNFAIDDERGDALAVSKSLDELRSALAPKVRAAIARTSPIDERKGITVWDFGDLPTMVESARKGVTVKGYPALLDDGDSVSIRVLTNPELQAKVTRLGVRRLLMLAVPVNKRAAERDLTNPSKLAIARSGVMSLDQLTQDCLTAAADRIVDEQGGPVWTAAEFDERVRIAKEQLPDLAARLLRTAAEVLAVANEVHARLEKLVAPAVRVSADDALGQLSRLIRPGFVASGGSSRVADLLRYVKAIDHRLAKLPEAPQKDLAHLRPIVALEQRYITLLRRTAATEITTDLVEIGWMLEELRVSVFAQQVGAAKGVSPAKITKALQSFGG
jgi:ATP-dependent helicase HrpA